MSTRGAGGGPPPATYGSSPALLIDPTAPPTTGTAPNSKPSSSSSESVVNSVTVHPLVLLSILDHHTRRAEGAGRVIGTLLGRRTASGTSVEITNAFAVPHAERGDEVAIGKDFNRQMLALHLRACDRRETVVGWYATALPPDSGDSSSSSDGDDSSGKKKESRCIADTSSLIHDFYATECGTSTPPVHLVVDTSLATDAMALRAYTSTPVLIKGEPLANLFHEVRLAIKSGGAERIVVDGMIKGQRRKEILEEKKEEAATEATDLALAKEETPEATLVASMTKLLNLLDKVSNYVDSVIKDSSAGGGTTAPTPDEIKLGMSIYDTLNSSIPSIRPEVFDAVFNDSLQDLLMVTYLANVTRTQLTIAEKLNETLGV